MKLSIWIPIGAAVVLAGCGESDPGITGVVPEGAVTGVIAMDGVQAGTPMVTFRSASAGYTFGFKWRFYSGAACTGTAGSLFSFPAITASGISFTTGTWASMQATAAATSSVGSDFAQWSSTDGSNSTDPVICIPAPTVSQTWTATYGQVVNTAPALAAIGAKTVAEGATLAFTATATDTETAASGLTFSLGIEAPAGASITTAGAFSWTPGEAAGPGEYAFNVCVHDDASPPLSDCEAVTVTVLEVNLAPVLDPVADRTVDAGTPLEFAATATDPDLPANALTFSLNGAPGGATIDAATGSFSWTPTAGGDFTFDVVVTDDGSPAMSSTRSVTVTVNFTPPVIDELTPGAGSAVRVLDDVDFTASFSAPGSLDHATCRAVAETATETLDGTEGSGTGSCTSTLGFPAAGVYAVTFTLTDDHGLEAIRKLEVNVYDPAGGSLTANGWIDSGAGIASNGHTTAGRTQFNLNSMYAGKSDKPVGDVAFQVREAGIDFRGQTQDWLVVDAAETTAALKGSGRLAGEIGRFTYLISLHPAESDGDIELRVRIWRGDDESDVIYDNGPGQIVSGGSIRIHRAGKP